MKMPSCLTLNRPRCSQHDSRHLSDEMQHAKQLHRRLERRNRRTGLVSDRRTYLSACLAANDSITRSLAESKLDEVAGDVLATWRIEQSLLHNNHQIVYSDAECAKLVSTLKKENVRLKADYMSQS